MIGNKNGNPEQEKLHVDQCRAKQVLGNFVAFHRTTFAFHGIPSLHILFGSSVLDKSLNKRSSDKARASNVGLKKGLIEVDIQTERKERTVELGQGRSEDASHLKNLLVLLNKKYVNCT